METRPPLVVLDMDGVLLDLQLDTEGLRAALRADFAVHGVHRTFRPLFATLDEALSTLEGRDPALAAQLRAESWARIDAVELAGARHAVARPGAARLLTRLRDLPVVLYTNNARAAARLALETAGLPMSAFSGVAARDGAGSLKPSGRPVLELAAGLPGEPPRRVYLLGDHPWDMRSARQARELWAGAPDAGQPAGQPPEVVALGLRCGRDDALEREGADFLVRDLEEAGDLMLAPRAPWSLSVVLLAYNEEGCIEDAVRDVRRFGELYLSGYEVLVVDDGSTDATAERVRAVGAPEVRLLQHERNAGMGTSMRTGYRAACKDYVAHLPGDRQVRPQALVRFTPHVRPDRVVLSSYAEPPSGLARVALSQGFRLLMRALGGLHVDFAGTYVVERERLRAADLPDGAASPTFLYSFQLLQRLVEAGCSVHSVAVHPFQRAVGVSREATLRRVRWMVRELSRHRLRQLRQRWSGPG